MQNNLHHVQIYQDLTHNKDPYIKDHEDIRAHTFQVKVTNRRRGMRRATNGRNRRTRSRRSGTTSTSTITHLRQPRQGATTSSRSRASNRRSSNNHLCHMSSNRRNTARISIVRAACTGHSNQRGRSRSPGKKRQISSNNSRTKVNRIPRHTRRRSRRRDSSNVNRRPPPRLTAQNTTLRRHMLLRRASSHLTRITTVYKRIGQHNRYRRTVTQLQLQYQLPMVHN